MIFKCNICNAINEVDDRDLTIFERETPSCLGCASSTRQRSLVKAIFDEYGDYAENQILDRKRLVGIGISDWEGLSQALSYQFEYVNTFFHKHPHIDITDVPIFQQEIADFLICSDVLEHVSPPVIAGFAGMFKILKPGGLLVFSIPYDLDGKSKEHFPNLYNYHIVNLDDSFALINKTRAGNLEFFDDLIFHGGPGTTLEMRRMALPEVLCSLQIAGFTDVHQVGSFPESGIVWLHDEGRTLIARKPLA